MIELTVQQILLIILVYYGLRWGGRLIFLYAVKRTFAKGIDLGQLAGGVQREQGQGINS